MDCRTRKFSERRDSTGLQKGQQGPVRKGAVIELLPCMVPEQETPGAKDQATAVARSVFDAPVGECNQCPIIPMPTDTTLGAQGERVEMHGTSPIVYAIGVVEETEDDDLFCRICKDDGKEEKLVAPCICAGISPHPQYEPLTDTKDRLNGCIPHVCKDG